MPQQAESARAAAVAGLRRRRTAGGNSALLRLMRYSYIFAATVREQLQMQPLRELSSTPLSLSQLHLLKLMARNGRCPVGRAAELLGVSPPAATNNVDKLERLGLLVRTPAPDDRRTRLLSLSPEGLRLVRRCQAREAARLAPAYRKLGARQTAQLTRLLERLALSLLDQEAARPTFCLRCNAYLESGCPVGGRRDGCPYQRLPAKSRPAGQTARSRPPQLLGTIK